MKILFDTDMSLGTPGAEIDDGAALILLLRAMGDRVTAVTTTHGNTNLEDVMQNTQRMLAYLGREDVPLGRGAAEALLEDKAWFAEWQAGYGQPQPWPHESYLPLAANLIIDAIRANPGEVTLIAVGPLTNLALALRLAPDIATQVKQVVIMGGSFGEAEPMPEFNAHCDPEAARIVLQASWPVRMIGLNITQQVPFRREEFAALPEANQAVVMLKRFAGEWIDRVEAMGWGSGGCALHDALAVAAVMDEGLFEWRDTAVHVELNNIPKRGAMQFCPPTPQTNIQVAVTVDAPRCHDLIWQWVNRE